MEYLLIGIAVLAVAGWIAAFAVALRNSGIRSEAKVHELNAKQARAAVEAVNHEMEAAIDRHRKALASAHRDRDRAYALLKEAAERGSMHGVVVGGIWGLLSGEKSDRGDQDAEPADPATTEAGATTPGVPSDRR